MDKPKKKTNQKPKPRPQTINHIQIKDAISDKAFLNWINIKYPNK